MILDWERKSGLECTGEISRKFEDTLVFKPLCGSGTVKGALQTMYNLKCYHAW